MHYSQSSNSGFTLIEIMVVILIISILTVGLFVPYNLYSNIAKVKQSKETFTQSLDEAKSSALGLSQANYKNQNFALFLKKGENTIDFVGFPYDHSGAISQDKGTVLRKIHLEKDVNITKIITNNQELDNAIFYFLAPNGEKVMYITPTQTGSIQKITIGLKTATSGILSKEIEISK